MGGGRGARPGQQSPRRRGVPGRTGGPRGPDGLWREASRGRGARTRVGYPRVARQAPAASSGRRGGAGPSGRRGGSGPGSPGPVSPLGRLGRCPGWGWGWAALPSRSRTLTAARGRGGRRRGETDPPPGRRGDPPTSPTARVGGRGRGNGHPPVGQGPPFLPRRREPSRAGEEEAAAARRWGRGEPAPRGGEGPAAGFGRERGRPAGGGAPASHQERHGCAQKRLLM